MPSGATLTTLPGVGAEPASPARRQDNGRIVIAERDAALGASPDPPGDSDASSTSGRRRPRDRPPVRIIVSRDLVQRLYQPLFLEARGAVR